MRPIGRLIEKSNNQISLASPKHCCYLFSLLLVSVLLLLLSSFCLVSFDLSEVDSGRLMVQQLMEVHVRQEEITHRAGAMELKSAVAAQQYNDACNGRRIYMYNLPKQFNTGILQQCGSQIVDWLNFCPHVQHNGFGRLGTSADNWADWYETDPYMLELIFHSRMAAYPCTTQVPHQADAFFIPYYSGLDALHYLYGKRKQQWSEHGLNLVKWLQENQGGEHWQRRGGHDHFIVMGRTAWDFTRNLGSGLIAAYDQGGHEEEGGWGTGFASLPEMRNVTALFLEGRPWQALEQAIPYPTGFHPSSLQNLCDWKQKVQTANRTFLMAFVGAPRPLQSCTSELHHNIRKAAIDQCAGNTTACSLLDCSKMKCAHASVPIAKRLLDATFCLQPPGDTVTRRSTFDSLLSGCIPVFFLNDTAYNQYTWHLSGLHPSYYSVFVPGNQLLHLLPLLSSFSAERIAHMRGFIVEHVLTRIIYASPQLAASHPALQDAFQLTLDNMLSRSSALQDSS